MNQADNQGNDDHNRKHKMKTDRLRCDSADDAAPARCSCLPPSSLSRRSRRRPLPPEHPCRLHRHPRSYARVVLYQRNVRRERLPLCELSHPSEDERRHRVAGHLHARVSRDSGQAQSGLRRDAAARLMQDDDGWGGEKK